MVARSTCTAARTSHAWCAEPRSVKQNWRPATSTGAQPARREATKGALRTSRARLSWHQVVLEPAEVSAAEVSAPEIATTEVAATVVTTAVAVVPAAVPVVAAITAVHRVGLPGVIPGLPGLGVRDAVHAV